VKGLRASCFRTVLGAELLAVVGCSSHGSIAPNVTHRPRNARSYNNSRNYAPRESSKATVEDLLNAWLRVIAPTEKAQPISPKTYEKYVSIVKGQLVPYLEKLPLQKLTPKHITEMQIKLREGGSAVLRVCMFTGFYIRRSTLELRRCECSKITPPPWCRLLRRHFEKSTLTRARSFC
jgi:hypothetical protein